ncbi:hypothetical protein SLE2022_315190 [Rubroshorea leprosula]
MGRSRGPNCISLLEELIIESCPMLKTCSMNGFSSHHRLLCLTIMECPKLMVITSLNGLTSLKMLKLSDCDGLTCLPTGLGSCISLWWLYIYHCKELRSIPEEWLCRLTCSKKLQIGGFWLKFEEFPRLSSIHHLCASLEELRLEGWIY